jgi:hypothetical protein
VVVSRIDSEDEIMGADGLTTRATLLLGRWCSGGEVEVGAVGLRRWSGSWGGGVGAVEWELGRWSWGGRDACSFTGSTAYRGLKTRYCCVAAQHAPTDLQEGLVVLEGVAHAA